MKRKILFAALLSGGVLFQISCLGVPVEGTGLAAAGNNIFTAFTNAANQITG